MPESRALPYFERRTTLDAIASLAEQRSIVIYAGAGVSIEKTDLTWPRIVDELLRRRIGDDRLSATVRTANPLQSASIVKQMYIAGYSDPDTLLADDLRSLLYPQQIWHRAELAYAVMRLATEMIDCGSDAQVVTTNYDDFLEQQQDLIDTARARKGLQPMSFGAIVPDYTADTSSSARIKSQVRRVTAKGKIIHLHGLRPPELG